jgi:hypothetical protein
LRSIIYVGNRSSKRGLIGFEVIHLYGTEGGWNKLKTLVDAHEDADARHQAFVDRIAHLSKLVARKWDGLSPLVSIISMPALKSQLSPDLRRGR